MEAREANMEAREANKDAIEALERLSEPLRRLIGELSGLVIVGSTCFSGVEPEYDLYGNQVNSGAQWNSSLEKSMEEVFLFMDEVFSNCDAPQQRQAAMHSIEDLFNEIFPLEFQAAMRIKLPTPFTSSDRFLDFYLKRRLLRVGVSKDVLPAALEVSAAVGKVAAKAGQV